MNKKPILKTYFDTVLAGECPWWAFVCRRDAYNLQCDYFYITNAALWEMQEYYSI
jgi:hypothetical protein